jgi:perosamine synthetase
MKKKLAINGGKKLTEEFFPSQNTIGNEEKKAVLDVMNNGRLSGFRANYCPEAMGGPSVQRLEREFEKRFNSKHAISVNSATSGLQIACGAAELCHSSEVIVSPFSMTCSATAPLIWGAVPIFADIEKDHYCLDPDDVERKITHKTKAIIPVSIFGQCYDPRINEIAKKHNLIVIEDAAQAIGSDIMIMGEPFESSLGDFGTNANAKPCIERSCEIKKTGTLGDLGIFSFNFGKHITCGEGGMIMTDDDDLAARCRLLRNNGEAVIHGMPKDKRPKYYNIIGFNMRMTEIDAAIVYEQLKKLDNFINQRRNNVHVLNHYLSKIPAITPSGIRPNATHSYYVCSYQWDSTKADGLHRDKFINAVKAELTPRLGREGEGVPIGCGYIEPLYRMPIFQDRKLYKGMGDWPFMGQTYHNGDCPVCEDLWKDKLFLTLYHAPTSNTENMMTVKDAFLKVWENRDEIK